MTITLNLDPEKEARLRREAAQHGSDVSDYLLSLTGLADDQTAPAAPTTVNTQQTIPQGSPEWDALLQSMGIMNDPSAVLSIEATSRESIYEDDLR